MNKKGAFLSFRNYTLPNRQVEFKFGVPRTELYAKDHTSNVHGLLGKGHRKPRRLNHLSIEPCSSGFF